MTHDELIAHAMATRERAYAPYSNFKAGAAFLGKSGRVYTAVRDLLSGGFTPDHLPQAGGQ